MMQRTVHSHSFNLTIVVPIKRKTWSRTCKKMKETIKKNDNVPVGALTSALGASVIFWLVENNLVKMLLLFFGVHKIFEMFIPYIKWDLMMLAFILKSVSGFIC